MGRDVRGGGDCDHIGLEVDGVCGACHEKLMDRNDLVGKRFKMDVRAYDEDYSVKRDVEIVSVVETNAYEREVEVVSVAETKPDLYGCRKTRIAVRILDTGRVIFGVTPGDLGIVLAW